MKTLLTLASLLVEIVGGQGWAMESTSTEPANKGKGSKFELLRSLPPAIFKATMDDLNEQGQTCAGATCKNFHANDDRYRAQAKRNAIVVPADKQYRNLRSFITYLYKYSRVQIPVAPSSSRNNPGDSKSMESSTDSKTKDIGSLITQIDLGLLQPEPSQAGSPPDASVGDVLRAIQTIFPDLQELRLANADLQESDLEIIGQMQNLRVLDLGGTSFYHAGIRHLSNLNEMRRLNLSAPGVAPSNFDSAAQFLHLSKMHHLVYLDFTQSPQTARAFQEWILSTADDKNGFAAYRRAVILDYGTDDHKGPPVDSKLAFAFYEKAAQLGHPFAQTHLAELYQKGIGVKKDPAQAHTWFKKAHRQGHAEARAGYWETRFSESTPDDLALKHATLLLYPEPPQDSPREHFEYQGELGWMYLEGLGVAQNDGQALLWLRKAAQKGFADAQHRLGFMYAEGRGGVQDHVRAVEWYLKVAEKGVADAQYNLGIQYEFGQGVIQDYFKAVDWFRKAADQDLREAQYRLGTLYHAGLGVVQDNTRAIEWYRRAAEKGFAEAQFQLGLMYHDGSGVVQDNVRAVEWAGKAAEQGLAYAQTFLGRMYHHGLGVDQDYAQAVDWYRKAAEQGNVDAQLELGIMHEGGFGVDPDREEAIRWYRLAATQGHEEARARLNVLEIEATGEL